MSEATYMGDKGNVPRIGDVVMSPGNVRGIVIALKGMIVGSLA
jgi:hypothetical protein